MKHIAITLITLVACAGAASALTVDNTAGHLASNVENASTVTRLTVTGTIDAADIHFITGMAALEQLDLSQATISAYSGLAVNGMTSYPANTIPMGAFAGTDIATIVLPTADGLVIADGAFAASGLTSVTLGANIAKIGIGAFANSEQLQTVTITAPEFAVADNMFSECTALETVNGSAKVTSIGSSAFAGCGKLEEFDFGGKLTDIDASAFNGSGLTSLDLFHADRLDSIGAWAFANSPKLEGITFHNTISHIGEGAFFNCPALVTINPSIEAVAIPDYAFTNASRLTGDHIIGPDVTTIGDYSLKGASHVTEVVLSPNLTYIGDGAMEGMTGLDRIDATALWTVPALGKDVWAGVEQDSVQLYAYKEMIPLYQEADQWKEFKVTEATAGPAIEVDDTASFTCRISGDMLYVTVLSPDVVRLGLFAINGMLLNTAATTQLGTYAFDLGGISDRYYIVTATFADGSAHAMKVARN